MLFESESEKLIRQLRNGTQTVNEKQLAVLLKKAKQKKPNEYDTVSKGLAQRFKGIQREIVKKALQDRYSRTYQAMPVDPVNWLRFFAIQDSGVYEVAPKRYLIDGENKLPVDDERAVYFHNALQQIGIDSKLKQMERRANCGYRCAIVAISMREFDGNEKFVGHLYWPHDVLTLAYPSDDVDGLYFCALKQNENYNGSPVWQVWTREFSEKENGGLVFSPWNYKTMSEDGELDGPSISYSGTVLPIAFLFTEDRDGFWPDIDVDISANVDNLNIARSNRQFVIDMQAHSQRVYRGAQIETNEIESGPDSIIKIAPTEEFEVISFNANHDAIEASASRDLQELGVSRGNSPDAYSVKPVATQSGIAKDIAKSPHDQRIEDMKPVYVEFEENYLLPIILDVIQSFSLTAPDMSGLRPKIDMAQRKSFEDDKILADRVAIMRNMQVIDRAEARVLLKLSKDRTTALADIAEADKDQVVNNLAPVVVDEEKDDSNG
jgi:hypothetical protein